MVKWGCYMDRSIGMGWLSCGQETYRAAVRARSDVATSEWSAWSASSFCISEPEADWAHVLCTCAEYYVKYEYCWVLMLEYLSVVTLHHVTSRCRILRAEMPWKWKQDVSSWFGMWWPLRWLGTTTWTHWAWSTTSGEDRILWASKPSGAGSTNSLPTRPERHAWNVHGTYMEYTWNVHGFNDREYGVNMGERIRRARSKSAMIYVWILIGKHMVKDENREGKHLPLRAVFRLSASCSWKNDWTLFSGS